VMSSIKGTFLSSSRQSGGCCEATCQSFGESTSDIGLDLALGGSRGRVASHARAPVVCAETGFGAAGCRLRSKSGRGGRLRASQHLSSARQPTFRGHQHLAPLGRLARPLSLSEDRSRSPANADNKNVFMIVLEKTNKISAFSVLA